MQKRCTVLSKRILVCLVSFWVSFHAYGLVKEKYESITPEIQDLFEDKKYTEIINELSGSTDTLNADALIFLGNVYSLIENPGAAIKTYTLALSKKDKNYEAKTLIGKEYLNLKKEREALAALREALDYNPKYEPAYRELERLYIRKNNKYELRTLFIDMVKHLGEKPEYFTRLCEISYQSGLYESAIQQCRKGIILDKEQPKNYVYLALTFKETGKIPECVDLLRRAANNFTKSYEAQFTFASILEEQKNFIEAQKYYRRATMISPESLKAMTGYAAVTVELQKFDEGLELFAKACKINKSAIVALRKAIVSLKGFKAKIYISKYEDLADVCGFTP